MNNNPRQVRPQFHGAHPHQHGHGNLSAYYPSQPGNIVRAKPPSFSRAPWDVTRWVDPFQSKNTAKSQKPMKRSFF